MQEWLWETAAELGRKIENGAIDPIALTEVYLEAATTHEFADRIYARLTETRARAEAKEARARAKAGLRLSPLDGVPISWKDLYDTAGIATESGTAMLADRIPEKDARVLQLATQAGLICLGKTHQTELAFSGLGYNPATASPPCANDIEAVSGGSSSGAGTSVAFGLAAAGIGSDTGGSVRIPSAWNDLVGLKTKSGRLSLEGVVPLCARFDTVGPLCRSVEDAALLLAAMENGKSVSLAGSTLKGVRLGVLRTIAFDGIEGAPEAGFNSAVERMRAAGATIETIEIPAVAKATLLGSVIFPAEAYGTWGHLIKKKGDKMFGSVRARFEQGATVLAHEFVAAWQKLDALRYDYRTAAAGFDAIILPSVPIMPPKMADIATDEELFATKNLSALQNTRIGNLMGLAAITIPTGLPSCGVIFQGDSEERLLRLAKAAEEALS